MNKILCFAAIGAASLFSFPAARAADPAPPPPASATPPGAGKLEQRLDQIAARLGLSDFQKGELKELLIQRREALRRADAASRRQFRAQLREILTPEQKAKFADLMAARRKAMAEAEQAHPTP